MLFNGDKLWQSISSAIPPKFVTIFKMSLYPVVLMPTYLNPQTFSMKSIQSFAKFFFFADVSSENFRMEMRFGMEGKYKIKKKVLYKNINKIIDKVTC